MGEIDRVVDPCGPMRSWRLVIPSDPSNDATGTLIYPAHLPDLRRVNLAPNVKLYEMTDLVVSLEFTILVDAQSINPNHPFPFLGPQIPQRPPQVFPDSDLLLVDHSGEDCIGFETPFIRQGFIFAVLGVKIREAESACNLVPSNNTRLQMKKSYLCFGFIQGRENRFIGRVVHRDLKVYLILQ
jgi:hypothetical protein